MTVISSVASVSILQWTLGSLVCGIFLKKACFVQELYENLCYILLYLRSTFICTSTAQCSGDHCNNTLQSNSLQVESCQEMLLIQSVGGLFIFLWSLVLVTVLFSVMWYFPVRVALACLPR